MHQKSISRTRGQRSVEFQAALAAPHDSMIFIEAIRDTYDAPQVVITAGHGMVDPTTAPASVRRPALNQASGCMSPS